MSVLVIERSKRSGSAVTCQMRDCSRSGAYRVTIYDWPAGMVCAFHRRQWRETWDAMLEGREPRKLRAGMHEGAKAAHREDGWADAA